MIYLETNTKRLESFLKNIDNEFFPEPMSQIEETQSAEKQPEEFAEPAPAEAVEAVYENRSAIKGLKMIYEPKYLRFFQARFEKLS